MAVFKRTLGLVYRLLSSRRQIVRFSPARVTTCKTHDPCFSRRIARLFSQIPPRTIVYTELKFTDHDVIGVRLTGKDGENIKRLVAESRCKWDVKVNDDYIRIEGFEYAVVKIAEEIVKQEVQTIRNAIHDEGLVKKSVFIDRNVGVRRSITPMFIGKRRQNIIRLEKEGGVNIDVSGGYVNITGTDGDAVRSAVEKVTQQLETFRNKIHGQGQFKGNVFIDDDVDVCNQITQMLIGKGGANIHRLQRESGVHINVSGHHVCITGTDGDAVRSATDKVTQELETLRNTIHGEVEGQFKEKVYIDYNVDVCQQIIQMLIGKGGANINRLERESGVHIQPQGHHVYITGTDGDAVRSATDKVTQELETLRNTIHGQGQFKETVFIDNDVDVRQMITSMLIGKGGAKINRLKRESGVHIQPLRQHVYITGTDGDAVRSATDKVTQELETIRNTFHGQGQFKGKVHIDYDVDVCQRITQMLIGKGGANINRLERESGVHIQPQGHHVYITGTDGDAVRSATDKVTQELETLRNHIHSGPQS